MQLETAMPGKYTEGYTKNAQNAKFIRHRDIKMKDSELKREAHIQKVMCEGVCRRCREKVQWRFKFDKYKPLKNIANCQGCKQKCVTKAYRTLCDKCGVQRNVCPGCCGPLDSPEDAAGAVESSADAEADAAVAAVGEDALTTVFVATQTKAAAVEAFEGENEGDEEQEEGEGEEDEEDEEEGEGDEDTDGEPVDESLLTRDIGDAPNWNEKKFKNIAATKYAKSRKVGDASDSHF